MFKNAKKIKLKSDIRETIDKTLDTSTLLRDMLKEFKVRAASEDEKMTVKELYRSCKNLKSVIATLAQSEQIFPDLIGKFIENIVLLRKKEKLKETTNSR